MEARKERVAVLSPVAWRTPPQQYGAWETVASNITEGLVARGWDVTLFATANSVTAAHLHAVVHKGYEEDHSVDPKVAEYLHLSEVFEHAAEFDLIHSHYDFMALAFSRLVRTPVLTTVHGFSSPQIMPVYEKYRDGYFSTRQGRVAMQFPVSGSSWIRYSEVPRELSGSFRTPGPKLGSNFSPIKNLRKLIPRYRQVWYKLSRTR